MEDGFPLRAEYASPDAIPATLQDFWRAEEAHLISDSEGAFWTVVHAPYRWESGSSCKSTWSASQFAEIDRAFDRAADRLPSHAFELPPEPSTTRRRLVAANGPGVGGLFRVWALPFHGAVVHALPDRLCNQPIILARKLAILDDVEVRTEATIVDLVGGLFVRSVAFSTPQADLRLRRTVFRDDINGFWSGARRFNATSAVFCGAVDAAKAKVADGFTLNRATFYGDFVADGIIASHFRIADTTFHSGIDLSTAQIRSVEGEGATFDHEVEFYGAKIDRLVFDRAIFNGAALFGQVEVTQLASFDRAELKRQADFEQASLQDASFLGTRFCAEVSFESAKFPTDVTFSRALFENAALFDHVVWPAAAAAVGQIFREARFKGYASFLGDFWAFSAFDGAKFDIEVRFSRSIFKGDKGLAIALEKAGTEAGDLEQLEHGLRVLKGAAEAVRDREVEHKLYAYQLKVRQRSPIDFVQKWALKIYALVSNYGLSLGRPIICVLCLWLLCAIVFLSVGLISGDRTTAGMHLTGDFIHPAVWQALEMSGRGVFNLLGTWSLRPPANVHDYKDLESALLFRRGDIALLVRLVWSIEAICAGVLIFLSALAVRRWFQIG